MRTIICIVAGIVSLAARGQDATILEVAGRGAKGGAGYQRGGEVRFIDASIGAQVIHYAGGGEMRLPLKITYEVLEPAPIVLSSRMGTEYWRLFHFEDETMSALYTHERIDLSQVGRHVASPQNDRAWLGERYGPLPTKGLVGIRGHYYFLIDPPEGDQWLDVTDPPAFFDLADVGRRLTFTLADLGGEWQVGVAQIQSTWKRGDPLRVRIAVTDSAGDALAVVNVPATASGDRWQSRLETEWGPLREPTGWMKTSLPRGEVPAEVTISGTVTAMTPDGLQERRFSARFERGEGQASAEEMRVALQGYQLPRNEKGVIRETRAMWVHSDDFKTPEAVENLVKRMKRARMNVIIPIIAVRNTLLARSDLMPGPGEGEDPLATLIERAHKAGLEVHPWFCVTYRDANFRTWFDKKFGVNVDVVQQDGSVASLPADVHRPEYRDFMVDLMVGVARDYDVDGIHLDYIRAMERCYCHKCRAEFQQKFGKPVEEATDDDWMAWQREAIGDIVRRTAEGVRKVRADAIMSAAVFSNMRGGALQGQDPARWAREGWMDVIIPMDYQMQSLQVCSNENAFLSALDDDDRLVTGLSLYMRSGGQVLSRPPELVREQIELVRRMGIHGYCLFAFGHFSDEQLEMLRKQANTQRAVPYFR